MDKLRTKLFLSIIIFALILVTTVSYVNREMLINDMKDQAENSRNNIESNIIDAMESVDNAYYYFDSSIMQSMEDETSNLLARYEQDPNILDWDLSVIAEELGMEVYILDYSNTIVDTSFEQDMGLDFSKCCENFSNLLDERREAGTFFSDGIDVSTQTGFPQKVSYQATPDKRYIIELSVDLTEEPILQAFDFVKTANAQIVRYEELLDVRIYSTDGFALGIMVERSIEDMSEQFQKAFKQAWAEFKPVEYKVKKNKGIVETYRFIPYNAIEDRGTSTERVLFVKYDNSTDLNMLKKNTQQFWVLLLLALAISFIVLLVVIRILTNTINLATYDSLTGVYNRATYISKMDERLLKRKNFKTWLMLIDLDNFKQVNDQYGHNKGDLVLVKVSHVLKNIIEKKGFVSRYGGDEFAVIVYDADEMAINQLAQQIINEISNLKDMQSEQEMWNVISVSIGAAILEESDESESSLFIRADKALYQSKQEGKDQVHIWSEGE
jgi:diguanylate cyclase (GGDEF)-like protein